MAAEKQKTVTVQPGIAPVKLPVAKVEKVKIPTPPKRQYELSDNDAEYLGKKFYSKAAWLAIAIRHGFDPETMEVLEGTNDRALIAVPKKYPKPEPQKANGPLTTKKLSTPEVENVGTEEV
jgi:hypothetical protein